MLITPENTLRAQHQFATAEPHEYKHPAIIGGFGSGKTHSIGLRWVRLIDYRATNQKIRCKLMIVEPTKEMIRDVLVPELNSFFDEFNIPHHYHKTYHNYSIWFRGHKFVAMLRSSDVPESLTGKTLTDIIIDEFDKKHSISHQRDVWNECIARTRKAEHGTCAVVTTPEGYKLTYELWGECDYRDKKNFKLIRADTEENHFLPGDYVENLYDQYSEELVKQYIHAQFINLTQGKVYYAFDREKNNTERTYDTNLPLKVFVDFNVNPMKWALGQKFGSYDFLVDQVVKRNTNTEAMAKEVGERYGYDLYYEFYGDYAGKARSTKSSSTDYDIIKQILPHAEFHLQPNPIVQDRINAVNSRLCNSKGERKLFINIQNCPDIVKDFEQVVWKENKNEIDKTTNPELTHISDAIGYYIDYEYSLKAKPQVTHLFGRH